MKMIKNALAASSLCIGGVLMWCAVSNLEAQEYIDSPLFDWKILAITGVIVFLPGLIYVIRRE